MWFGYWQLIYLLIYNSNCSAYHWNYSYTCLPMATHNVILSIPEIVNWDRRTLIYRWDLGLYITVPPGVQNLDPHTTELNRILTICVCFQKSSVFFPFPVFTKPDLKQLYTYSFPQSEVTNYVMNFLIKLGWLIFIE